MNRKGIVIPFCAALIGLGALTLGLRAQSQAEGAKEPPPVAAPADAPQASESSCCASDGKQTEEKAKKGCDHEANGSDKNASGCDHSTKGKGASESAPAVCPVTGASKKVGTTKAAAAAAAWRVVVTDKGYEPARITVKRGVPARVTFVRTAKSGCASEIVFPDHGIKKGLPENEPVTVTFTPRAAGEYPFTCGMAMLQGTVVVK